MPRYEFTLTISGEGATEEEAWADAAEAFANDPGINPEPGVLVDSDDDDGEEVRDGH